MTEKRKNGYNKINKKERKKDEQLFAKANEGKKEDNNWERDKWEKYIRSARGRIAGA